MPGKYLRTLFGKQRTARTPRRATRLTIVGGRPPSEVETPPVPEGIERTLRLAAANKRFRRRLLADRTGVIAELAPELTPTEMSILTAIPDEQLEGMIDGVAPLMPERRNALVRVAAAMGALLGGAGLTQSSCSMRTEGGVREDYPPPASDGIRPDEPPSRTKGIQPDEPPPKSESFPADDDQVATLGMESDVPPPKTRGISIDTPPTKTKGE